MNFQIQLNSFNSLLLGSPHQHAAPCPVEFPRHVTAFQTALMIIHLILNCRSALLCNKYLSISLTLALSLTRRTKPMWILDSVRSLNNQLVKVSVWLFFAIFSNEITGDSHEGNNIFTVWRLSIQHLWLSTQVIAVCSTVCTGNPIAWLSQYSPGDVLVA